MTTFLTRRHFNILSTGLVGLTVTGLGGCKPNRKKALTIGVLSPKTGLEAQVGLACERGAKVAAHLLQEIDPDIEIIYADTESKVEQGRTKAEKLISEGAHLLIGAHNSAVTANIAQVCEQHKIPLIINIAAATKLTEQGYKYTFRNFQTTQTLSYNGLMLMKELFEKTQTFPKTAAFIYINDTYGQSMAEAISNILPTLNMPFQLVDTIVYDAKTQDLSSEVSRLVSSKAELLIPVTRLNDAILLLRECVKQNYQPMGIISPGSPGMYERQFYKALGKHAEHCITNTSWFNPHSPLAQKVMQTFNKLYPQEQFDLNVAFTFEAVWIAVDAYKRAHSNEGEALQQSIKDTYIEERVVCGGPIAFDHKGQARSITSVAIQNKNGEPKIILPSNFQEETPIFPFPALH